jgi:hypothetical protein
MADVSIEQYNQLKADFEETATVLIKLCAVFGIQVSSIDNISLKKVAKKLSGLAVDILNPFSDIKKDFEFLGASAPMVERHKELILAIERKIESEK